MRSCTEPKRALVCTEFKMALVALAMFSGVGVAMAALAPPDPIPVPLSVPQFPLEPTEDGWSQIICVRQDTRVVAAGELE